MKQLIGHNIKRHREQLKISIRELAKKLTVSASFLSQLEKGKALPSVTTLKSIADALQTTVGILVGEGEKVLHNPLVRAIERKSLKNVEGQTLFLLTSPDYNKQMEPILFEFDENATSGDSLYQHFGQEFVFILDGGLEITLNEKRYFLDKGDSIYFNSQNPHFVKNVHQGVTRALWVITPPTF